MNESENKNNLNNNDGFVIGSGFVIGDDYDDSSFYDSKKPDIQAEKKPKSRRKKRSGWGVWLWLISIVVISVALASCLIIAGFDYLGLRGGNRAEIVVQIEQGTTAKQVAHILKESGAINNELMFRIYSKLSGYENSYKYGLYTFSNELSYEDIAEKLQNEGARASSIRVTIPEQSNIDDIAKILEEKGVCTVSDFKNAMANEEFLYDFVEDIPTQSVHYRFEGYLFPDTYEFYYYDSKACAKLAIDKMLKVTNERVFTEANIKKAQELGYTMHEVLTMASIVELEASGQPTEMANVAAVFYNRLKWDEPKMLGSSPTAEYPYGNGRYDTNKTEGLPPGPECSPSINAVNASLNPTAGFKYTYFVTDKNMKFYYTSSYSQHIAIIKKLKSQGKWAG